MPLCTVEYLRELAAQPAGNTEGFREGLRDAADEIERLRKIATQIKARSAVSSPDDEKELRRQMAHIASLADAILEA